jgi:hypothetical protein
MPSQFLRYLLTLLALLTLTVPAVAQTAPRTFPQNTVRFEQNSTDGDVEVVFEVSGRSEGLTSLTIKSPDGRTIVDFKSDKPGSPVASGIRQFLFESPEPKDIAALKKTFPEGTYIFEGSTESGDHLRDEATLSHKLPPVTSFILPKPAAKNVTFESPKMFWANVPDVKAYKIELEQEDTGEVITATLSPKLTHFIVPHGFTKADTEYKFGVGTVSKEGNVSFVEMEFTTAPAK